MEAKTGIRSAGTGDRVFTSCQGFIKNSLGRGPGLINGCGSSSGHGDRQGGRIPRTADGHQKVSRRHGIIKCNRYRGPTIGNTAIGLNQRYRVGSDLPLPRFLPVTDFQRPQQEKFRADVRRVELIGKIIHLTGGKTLVPGQNLSVPLGGHPQPVLGCYLESFRHVLPNRTIVILVRLDGKPHLVEYRRIDSGGAISLNIEINRRHHLKAVLDAPLPVGRYRRQIHVVFTEYRRSVAGIVVRQVRHSVIITLGADLNASVGSTKCRLLGQGINDLQGHIGVADHMTLVVQHSDTDGADIVGQIVGLVYVDGQDAPGELLVLRVGHTVLDQYDL